MFGARGAGKQGEARRGDLPGLARLTITTGTTARSREKNILKKHCCGGRSAQATRRASAGKLLDDRVTV
jgi:hypothetical protein